MTSLELDKNGYLDPIVINTSISLGESYFENEDFFKEIFMSQVTYLMKVMI